MDQNQEQSRWDQIKAMAKKTWSDLTNEDFNQAEGSAFKLYGVILAKFGNSNEVMRDMINQD